MISHQHPPTPHDHPPQVTYAIIMAVIEHCHHAKEEPKEEAMTQERYDEVMNVLDV